MTVGLIWAQSAGGVIGAAGGIPWHVPEDARLFKELTWGSAVVMGRLTWESLPERFRPLPGRDNVVLTSRAGWSAAGATVAASVPQALAGRDAVWGIGGAAVYAAMLPSATVIVRTEIDASFDGDTFAPPVPANWQVTAREPESGWATSSKGLRYAVSELVAPGVKAPGVLLAGLARVRESAAARESDVRTAR